MDFINLMLEPLSWPSGGVWEPIIKWFTNGLGGKITIALILLTICLKVVMLPLDFWQRYSMRKMTQAQTLLKDDLDAIKAKYKDNPQMANQKTMELYRKNNVKPAGGCLPMLIYMIVTFVVFFTLFSALGNISRTKISYEYYQLDATYVTEYQAVIDEGTYDTEKYVSLEAYANDVAQEKVVEKYDQIREGFLSIKTIWRPDNWSSVFPDHDSFLSGTSTSWVLCKVMVGEEEVHYAVKRSNGESTTDPYIDHKGKIFISDTTLASITINEVNYDQSSFAEITPEGEQTVDQAVFQAAKNSFKADFNDVTGGINRKYSGQWNGYLGLIILTAVITFLSQFLSSIGTKTKDKKGNVIKGQKANPILGIVMAGIMVMFTISYTSLFAIYICVSNIVSVGTSIGINLIMNKIEEMKDKKRNDKIVPDYVRR